LRTRAIPERFCGGDSLRRGAISSVCTFTLPLPLQLQRLQNDDETGRLRRTGVLSTKPLQHEPSGL